MASKFSKPKAPKAPKKGGKRHLTSQQKQQAAAYLELHATERVTAVEGKESDVEQGH